MISKLSAKYQFCAIQTAIIQTVKSREVEKNSRPEEIYRYTGDKMTMLTEKMKVTYMG